jgi:hypothetical protein
MWSAAVRSTTRCIRYPLKEKPDPLPHNHLYRNDGNGHFTDVTDKAGLNPDMYSVAVTAADYDNDGFMKICW